MHTALVIATVLPTLVAAPRVASAKPKSAKPTATDRSAKAHMNRAAKAHKAGKFDVALTELEAAYAIDPQPKLLFAMGQVQQKLDRCDDAITNYEKFLATTTDKQQQTVVHQAISACMKKLADEPAPAPAASTSEPSVFRDQKPDEPAMESDDTPLAAPEPARSEATTRRESPWYKDVLGDALVVSGIASTAASVVLYLSARSDLDAAEAAGSLADYEVLVQQAQDRRTYSIVLGAAGGALIGAGLLRYALRDSGEKQSVALAPLSGGGLVTWGGGF
jgi:tetratricopeptide (TPR) repeat protein